MARAKPTGAEFVAEARRFLGRPYKFGAAGPNEFDCSGLVQYSLKQIGVTAPRTSEEQFAWCEPVSTPQAGDLVFFVGAEGEAPPGHVGIVVAPGTMIDAPHTGTVVQQANYGTNGTGVDGFMGFGKVPGLAGSSSTANQSLITKRDGSGSRLDNEVGQAIGTIASYAIMVVVIIIIVVVLILLVMHFK